MRGGFIQSPVDTRVLLVSCSAKKINKLSGKIKARDLYTGTLIRTALRFADVWGLESYIVSAKYGLIRPFTKIEWYDQKLTSPYPGPWPKQSGFYVGSNLYFGKAPSRFVPLTPVLPIGKQIAYLKQLILTGPPT